MKIGGYVQIGDTPIITVTETGTYTLYVIDEDNGCIASDQVIVSPDAEQNLCPAPATEPVADGHGRCDRRHGTCL